jgi:hypothetical protein
MGYARNRACNGGTTEDPVMSTDSRSQSVPSLVRILGLLWLGLPLSGQVWTQLAPTGAPPRPVELTLRSSMPLPTR